MPDLGEWLPDMQPYGHGGLVQATNVYPTALGYAPIPDVSATTTALPYQWQGGGSFVNIDGTTANLAGTSNGLYLFGGSSWTLKYSGTYTGTWAFAQFGSIVVCVNGAAPVKYDIAGGAASLLGGTPPSASMIAIVRDFVFLAGNGTANSTLYWSGINAPESWTVGINQSDYEILPDGGPITGLAGGEYGLVFQERAIHRMTYVGTPVIFERDKIVDGVGSIAPGSVATFGRMTFFLSPRGFYSISDGGLTPIGNQKVDATFWSTYTRAQVKASIQSIIDPKNSLVIWSMPGQLWIYNWVLARWTMANVAGAIGLETGITPPVSLEGVDVLYPGGIDTVPVSLDSVIFLGGDPMVSIARNDNKIYALASTNNLAATLQLPMSEPFGAKVARIRRARVIGDMTTGVTVTVGCASRIGDAQTSVSGTTMTASGHVPLRAAGRVVQPTLTIAYGTPWSFLRGLEFDQAPGGSR